MRNIEHSFAGVVLGNGRTLYEAAFHADYCFDECELERAKFANRRGWTSVPPDDLFARNDAIFFMDSVGKRFYTPAILRALLSFGPRDGLMYDCFIFDLGGFVHQQNPKDISFASLYNASQRASIVRFLKYAAYNAPKEFGRDDPLCILKRIGRLAPAPRD